MIVWTDRNMLFAPNDIVRHTNGSAYRILTHCLRESDSVECHAYRDTRGGVVWVRPADEMEDGRFTLVERAKPETAAPDDQEDLIVLMAGLLREAIDADNQHDTVGRTWYRRAANALSPRGAARRRRAVSRTWYRRAVNALSRLQDAPAAPVPTDDTIKPSDAPTGRSGSLSRQVDGDHYHQAGIQPWDIWEAYRMDPWEANALKYLLRRKPGVDRATDLRKAAHYVERCIEREQAAARDLLECD